VSCIPANGCNGYNPEQAINWIITSSGGGLATEAAFPYNMADTNTSIPACPGGLGGERAVVTSAVEIGHTVAEVQAGLMRYGPLSIIIDATSIFHYGGGVISDPVACSNANTPELHAVLLVGWGTEAGQPVWYFRNSWNTDWGVQGYAFVLRDAQNVCGLLNYPVAATV